MTAGWRGQAQARPLPQVRTMHALDHKNILHFFAWCACRGSPGPSPPWAKPYSAPASPCPSPQPGAPRRRYETTNHLWLILEYCVGGDLVSLLEQDKRLPENSVHDFGRDLVVALQYLHANSIVYCDLKPSNILLDENGRLKLGGFGLSRRLADINKTPPSAVPPVGAPSPRGPAHRCREEPKGSMHGCSGLREHGGATDCCSDNDWQSTNQGCSIAVRCSGTWGRARDTRAGGG